MPPAPRLPDDQTVRDRIAGVLRFGAEGRIEIGGPIARDPHFCADRNFVVVAGAGSGKTHALVWRMAALVRSGVPAEALAAITFTRKAAGEMKARFFEALTDVRAQLAEREETAADDGEAALYAAERRHVERALRQIEHVFVDTIHAFCARLLRERPLEAGLVPGFATVEDRDEEIMRRRFWQAHLARTAREDPERIDRLVEMGVEPQELFGYFGDLCDLDDLPVHADDHPRPDLEGAVETVAAFVERWQSERPHPRPLHRDDAMQMLDEAEHFLAHHGVECDGDRARLVALFENALQTDKRKSTDTDERGKVTAKRWTDAGCSKEAVKELDDEALPELVQRTVRPVLRDWRAHLYPFVHAFAAEAVAAYEAHRYREGQLTFRDLLKGAARLLRDDPSVRRFFRRTYRRLLIDEFQDTDPLQAEVLFLLTGEDTEATDWRRCRPAPGSLFIVGDVKQSIYRFRRADVGVFDEVCRLLTGDGQPLALTANFRSTRPLCAWCNDAIARPFDAHPPPYGTPYERLRAFRDDAPDAPAVHALDVPYVKGHPSAGIAEHEAERIATHIRAACLAGAAPGDFMILARLSKRLSVHARALEAAGIPYVISGGKALGGSDELRAVLRLLETLLRPDDPVALAAFLTGPFCGLGADALYRFRRAGGAFGVPYAVPDALVPPDADRFRRGFAVPTRMRALLAETTLAAALETILEETGFFAWAARTAPGSSRAGNLLRILAIVRGREAQGATWPEVIEELQLLEAGEIDAEELTLEAGSPGAVRLMTVHQSKGLQARVVFMVDPYDSRHDPQPRRHVGRDAGGRAFAVVPASVRRGPFHTEVVAAPLRWAHAVAGAPSFEEEARRYDAAEHRRIVYVAATRAEDVLVVSRYVPKPDDGFWCDLYAALEDAPPLPVPSDGEMRTDASDAPRYDWDALRAERARRRAAVERPTYAFASVTDRVKGAVAPPADLPETPDPDGGRRSARARAFGTATHRLFEEAIRHGVEADEAPALARSLLEEQLVLHPEARGDAAETDAASWLEAQQEAAVRALASFRASDVWAEIEAAGEVYVELPFAAAGDAADPTVVTGAIDLIYRSAAGWKIVDFKTDRVENEAEMQTRIDQYGHQLAAYARHWAALVGEPPVAAGIWFTRRGEYVPCDVPDAVATNAVPSA